MHGFNEGIFNHLTLVVPGNDNTHASVNGIAAHQLIPGSELYQLPIQDEDVPLLPFSAWAAAMVA